MNPHAFIYGPRLHYGTGASARIGEWLPDQDVLFVTDQAIMDLGLADAILARLLETGRAVTIFSDVEGDPSVATLQNAVDAGRVGRAGAVVGFGGGSPMDVAKMAAYLLGSDQPLDDLWGVGKATGQGLPLALVPTTAGTGSEATPVAIFTLPGGEKRGVSSPALLADAAFLDPALTTMLPAEVTAATGMDAIVHAIEAYTSAILKNPMADMLAKEALRLLTGNLQLACDQPANLEARSAMLLGAHLAGVAFANAPVAGVHALAYPLGGRFHVPHGVSNAVMLPHVLRFNSAAAAPLYAELAAVMDPALADAPAERGARLLVDRLEQISRAIGLPQSLSALGIAASHVGELAADAMLQERLLQNNPRPITQSDAMAIYEAAL